MDVRTQERPAQARARSIAVKPAAATAGTTATHRGTTQPATAHRAPGVATDPLAATLTRCVATRTSAPDGREAVLQRALSFKRQYERNVLPKKYIETAVADFEILRTAIAALRKTATEQSAGVAAWLNSALDPMSAFITLRDDKPVPYPERDDVVRDMAEHSDKLAKLRKALPAKIKEDRELRRTTELGRADTIESRIRTSEGKLTELVGFLTPKDLEAILASAGTARSGLETARGLLGETPDLEGAGSRLTGADSDVEAIERVVAGGTQRKELATRRAAVVTAQEGLKRPRPKERMTELLLLLDGLSPEQQIASLTDVSIKGGISDVEAELAAAQDVDTTLDAIITGATALRKNALFVAWGQAEIPRLKALTWEQLVVSNGDSSADPGLKRLLKGVENAKLAVPRLKSIVADIDKLKLEPLKTHLEEMQAKVAASWTEQVADLTALEDGLKFAKDIDERRKQALAALPGLSQPTQRANIEGWLHDNAALTWDEQKHGLTSEHRREGLKNIEARIAMYNATFRNARDAEVRAEQDRLARIEAARIRKAAEKAATNRLLTASNPSAVLLDLYSRSEIHQGTITETYKSSYDSGLGEFSAEVLIGGLKDIVIHAHCAPDGRAKPGNAVHWKELRYKHLTGPQYSHPVPDSLRPHLLDATRMKNNRDANSKINWR
jgi:hypothetical protein